MNDQCKGGELAGVLERKKGETSGPAPAEDRMGLFTGLTAHWHTVYER